MTTLTATAILTKAYRDAGKLARGATPSSDQLADGIDILNDLIYLWTTQGLKLFLESEIAVTLVAGRQAYTFMPSGSVSVARPLEVKQVVYVDSSGNTRPLSVISRDEWMRLSPRAQSGSVNQYFVDPAYDRQTLNVWSVPDATAATGTLRVLARQPATSLAAGGDTIRIPQEWAIALRWGVADELCSGMPMETMQRCQQRAAEYRAALEAFDVERAETYFQPNPQSIPPRSFA